MRSRIRWGILIIVVVAVAVVALRPLGVDAPPGTITTAALTTGRVSTAAAPDDAVLEEPAEGLRLSGVVEADSGTLGEVYVVWEAVDPQTGEVRVDGPRVERPVRDDGSFSLVAPGMGELRTEPASYPSKIFVDAANSALRFRFPEPCPVAVRVEDQAGAPVVGVSVRVLASVDTGMDGDVAALAPSLFATDLGVQETGPGGMLQLDEVPCGVVQLIAEGRTYFPEAHKIDTVVEKDTVVTLRQGVWVHGVVSDSLGEPIEGAQYAGHSESTFHKHKETDANGVYELVSAPDSELSLSVHKLGYLSADFSVHVPEDVTELEIPLLMEDARLVTVRCLGLPGDSCADLYPIQCGVSADRVQNECRDGSSEPVCGCPLGDALVTAGGRSVVVAADEDVAIVDYRGTAVVSALIHAGGEPATSCMGSIDGMFGQCDHTGRLAIFGVAPGERRLFVDVNGVTGGGSFEIHGGANELGTIEVGGSGRIEGVLLGAETGEGVPGVALNLFCRSGEEANMAMALTHGDGVFSFENLTEGVCRIDAIGDLSVSARGIEVISGETLELELIAKKKEPPPPLDFDTQVTGDGRYQVSHVEEGGDAEAFGLLVGDILLAYSWGEDMQDWGPSHSGFDFSEEDLLAIERDGEAITLASPDR